MTQLNRRNALTLVATLPTLAVPAAALAAPIGPDQELVELGRRFDALERQFHEVNEKARPRNDGFLRILKEKPGPRSDADYEEIGRRLDREFGPEPKPSCDDLGGVIAPLERRIMELPALTFAGLAVKARVARFECSHFYREEGDAADWDHQIARALIDSVLASASGGTAV